jgi:multiple sugar transport system permease protein
MTMATRIARRGGWSLNLHQREAIAGYLFLMPWILGFLLFTIGPLLYSFYLSFTNFEILSDPVFAGLTNFRTMIHDDLFWQALKVTVIFTVTAVPLGVVVGYSLALLLNQKVIALSVWRTVYYIPSIVPALASAYLFAWMFNSEVGLINGVLKEIGIIGPKWFASREWVIPSFLIMSLWGAGGGMLLYLGALQGVPTELYEASMIDGAGAWAKFRYITIPMTSPVILFTFLTGLIGTFQIFTGAFIVTNGGPANASLFYVLYLYQNAWQYLKMGYAAALAWVLFMIILVLTLITLKVTGRLVYYGGGEQ